MTQPLDTANAAVSDADVQEALQGLLPRQVAGPCRIAHVERRPTPSRSSFALDEVTVRLETGASLSLMFKDLSPQALVEGADNVKPAFLYDPRREIEVYRAILSHERFGTPAYYGAVVDEARGRYWLFIERVPGVELYQLGDLAIWKEAARRLARLHLRLGETPAPSAETVPLVRYDAGFYRRWALRARSFLPHARPSPSAEALGAIDRLVGRYDRVVERLTAMPATVIHGECYPSNILVHELPAAVRICLVDWETAALGPGLVDLAALTSGRWTDRQRAALAMAYYAAAQEAGGSLEPEGRFLETLDYCRLHLAVQLLGWSQAWSAPPQHAHDWLGEALRLSERLSI